MSQKIYVVMSNDLEKEVYGCYSTKTETDGVRQVLGYDNTQVVVRILDQMPMCLNRGQNLYEYDSRHDSVYPLEKFDKSHKEGEIIDTTKYPVIIYENDTRLPEFHCTMYEKYPGYASALAGCRARYKKWVKVMERQWRAKYKDAKYVVKSDVSEEDDTCGQI